MHSKASITARSPLMVAEAPGADPEAPHQDDLEIRLLHLLRTSKKGSSQRWLVLQDAARQCREAAIQGVHERPR